MSSPPLARAAMSPLELPHAAVDLEARRVRRADGADLTLTEQEAAILRALADRAGEAVPRDELLVRVLGYSPRSSSRAADHTVARLRDKIERDPRDPRSLLTAHGVGYRLVVPSAETSRRTTPPRPPGRRLIRADVVVDLDDRAVTRDGRRIPLSDAEVAVLDALDRARGRPVDRETLSRRARGGSSAGRALDHLVYRLRTKIEADPDAPAWLLTERGFGYRLATSEGFARPPDGLVGRDEEIDAVGVLLATSRLVTLVGAGGIGKTRLAAEVVDRCRDRFAGGAVRADLGEVADEAGVCAAVGVALTATLGADPVGRVGAALAHRGRALLYLDEAEASAASLGPLLSRWLADAPDLRVLVTSREALRIAEERVHPVPPLPTAAAARLFLLRAAAARPGFVASDDDRVAVDEIARRLDGLPLAVELAAARVRVMSVPQVLERVDRPLQLLAGTGFDTAARRATMRGAIEASARLLDDVEAEAYARLATFRGGFDLEAAEVVLEGLASWPADLLRSLADRSLLVVEEREGVVRYRMYEPVREHASERLAAHGASADARHGRALARLGADEAIEALDRHGGVARRRARLLDLDNLLAAVSRAIVRRDADVAAACAVAASELLRRAGRVHEAADVVERARTLEPSDSWRRRLLRARGACAALANRIDAAEADLGAAIADLREHGEIELVAGASAELAAAWVRAGRYDDARGVLLAALAEPGRSEIADARLRSGLANVDHNAGRYVEAEDGYRRAAAVLRDHGDLRAAMIVEGNLANLLKHRGRYAEALAGAERAVALAVEVGDVRNEARIRENKGILELHHRRVDAAVRELETALRLAVPLALPDLEGGIRCDLGLALGEARRRDEALTSLTRGIALLDRVGARGTLPGALACRGGLYRDLGRPADALADFDRAIAVSREVGSSRMEALVLANRAALRLDGGDLAGALADVEAARAPLADTADPLIHAEVLAWSSRVLLAAGDVEGARDGLARATAAFAGTGLAADSDVGKILADASRRLQRAAP